MTVGATFGVIACFAVYYLTTAFALGYATKTLGIDRQVFLSMQIAAILFMGVGIALAGWWSDKIGAGRVLIYGTIAAILTGLLLAPALESGSLVIIFIGLSFSLLVMGFVYGPLGAWLPRLFPARVRYPGVSMLSLIHT